MKSTKATNKIVSAVFAFRSRLSMPRQKKQPLLQIQNRRQKRLQKRQKMRLFMGMEQEKNVRRSMHRTSDSKMKKEN